MGRILSVQTVKGGTGSRSQVHLLASLLVEKNGATIALTACGETLDDSAGWQSEKKGKYIVKEIPQAVREVIALPSGRKTSRLLGGLSCSKCSGIRSLTENALDITDDIIVS